MLVKLFTSLKPEMSCCTIQAQRSTKEKSALSLPACFRNLGYYEYYGYKHVRIHLRQDRFTTCFKNLWNNPLWILALQKNKKSESFKNQTG